MATPMMKERTSKRTICSTKRLEKEVSSFSKAGEATTFTYLQLTGHSSSIVDNLEGLAIDAEEVSLRGLVQEFTFVDRINFLQHVPDSFLRKAC